MKSRKLNCWERLAIEAGIESLIKHGKIHTEHGTLLLNRIVEAPDIVLTTKV